MRRRAPWKQTNGHSLPPKHAANHCRALVLVDGAAVRKKIKRDYEKALRDLERSRRQLDQFQQTDLPEFTRWFNGRFGPLLTELRELSQKIAADEALIFAVESEMMFGGGSHAKAYQRVMEMRENPPPPPRDSGSGGGADPADNPFGAPPKPDEDDFDDDDDLFDTLFDELFGGSGPGKQTGKGPGSRPAHEATHPSAPVTARLKELYRKLVRRLHPDTQEKMTPQKTEWWHQAQAAYTAGDAEQLEVILTLCEISETGATANTSATLLHRITAQLKSSLLEIKRQLSARRKDPAWNFSKRPDRETLAARLLGGMTYDLELMRHRWRDTQELIAKWKKSAERRKKTKSRRQPETSEFPF